jgi:methylmalonyl-CoA/ethylmalonyl-CoA epimerase
MAKLRHIAVTVPDVEAAATFYEKTFDLKRIWKRDLGIMLSDGTVSLAVLKFPTDEIAGDERGKDFHGLHHMGFVADDLDDASQRVADNGGKYHMRMPGEGHADTEQKFRDPNGIVFDIVNLDYATKSWGASD